MRILVIGNGSSGIDEISHKVMINNHTGFFIKEISKYHKVTFAQFSTVFDPNSNLHNMDMVGEGINFYNLPNIVNPMFLFSVLNLIPRFDFIYIYYPGTLGTVIGMLARALKLPFGLYVRGEYFNKGWFDRVILKNCKFILTISPTFVPGLKAYCEDVEVIKPMISITTNDFILDRDYNSPKVTRLLFVGRIEKAKGIYELMEIAETLKKNNVHFVLDIIGGGDLFDSIGTAVIELGLTDSVFLHGQISDAKQLNQFYEKANVFLFPSHHEGFPRVLYEAMSSALPIFTTFVGGIPGRMVHLENCIEIPAKDGNLAGQIILKHLYDVEVLASIGKNGQVTLRRILEQTLKHEELILHYLKNDK